MTKFHDANVRPPNGGWSFPIGGQLVTKYSESEIVEEIIRFRRNNGTLTSEGEIRAELWEYYCSREPQRCGRKTTSRSLDTQLAQATPAEKTPELQGPAIWRFLNTVAAAWTPPLHDYFQTTLDNISSILECPKCKLEWQEILASERATVAGIGTRLGVCQWVNKVHNRVNARIGKPEYTYLRMVVEYGAPIP